MFKQFHDKNQITDIVCLLNEKEDSSKFAEYALKAGVTWHWLPLQGASISYLSGKETQILIIQMAQDVVDLIKKDEKHTILVHCSAGCHRTGFFAYTVLRLLGHDPVRARAGLLMMRRETGVDVGEHRLQVCEDMLVSHSKV
jgi:protein tyrosine phosphatase